MANITDGRCWRELKPDSPSLLQNGNLVFQAHHVGWIVTGFFTVIAIITSAWLINKHLVYYTNKREQRYIVRILFMVPIYAIISFASYLFWNHSTPLLLIRDGYESTVLTSFFYLLLNYLSHDIDEQKAIFMKNGLSREYDREALRKGETPSKWMFPLGFVKWKPVDGLMFLQLMKWGVLQYCVIRPTTTLAAVLLNYVGLYCEDSWSLGWGHSYITVIVSISVTVAMYCLLQLYLPVSKILAPQKPLLKLFSVKAIVFLTFWQATFLSVLSMFGVIKDTTYMTADDINIGIGAIAETFEMMLFGFLHIRAFTYKPYLPSDTSDPKLPGYRMSRWRALGHAMDFRETFRELWTGTIYLWEKMRGRHPKSDISARRVADYESAFGAPRRSETAQKEVPSEKKDPLAFPMIRTEREYYESPPSSQWLGYGNNYGYGVFREKSDDLETQIERELERRGYGSQIPGRGHIKPVLDEGNPGYTHQPQRSWWRSIYNRVSQSGPEDENRKLTPTSSRHASRRKSKSKSREPSKSRPRNRSRDVDGERDVPSVYPDTMDDPPPPSLFRSKRSPHHKADQGVYSPVAQHGDEDILAPLSSFNDHQSSYLQRPPQQRKPSQNHRSHHITSPPMSPTSHRPELTSSPPPQSLLAPMMMPHGDVSADSLLGRVFPSKSSDAKSSAHGTDNTHSTGYVHQHPRTTVPSREGGYDIGVAGERTPTNVPASHSFDVPQAMSATVINPTSENHRGQQFSGETAAYRLIDDRYYRGVPPASVPVMHAPEVPRMPQEPSSPHPVPSPRSLNRPSRLRRSSAQVYSPHESSISPTQRPVQAQPHTRSSPPRQPKRHFTPVILTVPELLAAPPQNVYSADRPVSTRYSLDSSSSTLAQPSLSGQLDNTKFSSPGLHLEEDLGTLQGSEYSRYPGMLDHDVNQNSHRQSVPMLTSQQQAQSNQEMYKYPSHSQYQHHASREPARAPQSRANTNDYSKDRPTHGGPWS
ncbi:hypothetical protein GYMLUDRAFT_43292 [Collybiopsis luxurians FD-317 M1]|uniref:DUF300-domain-containing protein n=1 Tax=Collybiopsis luxurians FD-317 M1 TaxID=944289 RepID=A0A0D0BBV4_9AGAR|nr:hypothetical protein GYMLUDRAFT_43292 [Collybiopsis luxurians FD-317 M1]